MANPNINLRVFRRSKQDMSLIYNKTELNLPSKFEYETSIYINDKKIYFIEEVAKARDNSAGDICLFIPYQENNLNDSDAYNVNISFTPKLKRFSGNTESIEVEFPNTLSYSILVQPRGILSASLKDDKQMFTQSFCYDPKTNKWERTHIIKDEDFNKIMVQDNRVIKLLEEIKELLMKK